MPEESKICFSQKIPVGPFQKAVKEQLVTFLQVFRFLFISFFWYNHQYPPIFLALNTQFLASHPKQTPLPSSFPRSSLGLRFNAPSWEQVDPEKKVQPDNDDLEDHIFYGWCCFYWVFLAWFLLLNRFLLVINSKEITFFAANLFHTFSWMIFDPQSPSRGFLWNVEMPLWSIGEDEEV